VNRVQVEVQRLIDRMLHEGLTPEEQTCAGEALKGAGLTRHVWSVGPEGIRYRQRPETGIPHRLFIHVVTEAEYTAAPEHP
jgi:hypothetical protein